MSEVSGGVRSRLLRRRPPEWRQIAFPKRGVQRSLRQRGRIRQRARDVLDHVRLWVRSAPLWGAIATWLFATGHYAPGAVAACFTLVCVVFHPRIREFDMHLDSDFRTDSAEFLSTLAGVSGVPLIPGNRITILNNGDEFYPEMLETIRRAQYSVTMEQYVYTDGEIGRRFAEAFAERARAGVSVKLLVDAVGGALIGHEIIRVLEESGCELCWFHPIRWYNLRRLNNRTHRKSVIIDGRIAFTGGAGFDDQWCGTACRRSEWRDLQIRLEGPGVVPLQAGFAVNWLETTGEVITGPRFYPVPDAAGGVDVQTVMSSPKSDVYTASILYSLVILCARRSVFIANPYFVPGYRTIEMFAEAVERGVDVKILLSGPHCDTWWARMNSVRLYGKLLDAGVELYEYLPTMLHQKTMIVDDIWATVGTANFDHRSFQHNEESNVCFYDPDLVQRLRDIFFEDLKQAERIDRARWTRRGRWKRYGELVAALLKDQV